MAAIGDRWHIGVPFGLIEECEEGRAGTLVALTFGCACCCSSSSSPSSSSSSASLLSLSVCWSSALAYPRRPPRPRCASSSVHRSPSPGRSTRSSSDSDAGPEPINSTAMRGRLEKESDA
jgi:hypothetical protein